MDALPFLPIELVAIDPVRNLRRRWRVAAMRDLFGQVVVETSWGRIGTRGRTLTRSFAGEAEALAHVRALLRRRSGAVRRIGVAYMSACRQEDIVITTRKDAPAYASSVTRRPHI